MQVSDWWMFLSFYQNVLAVPLAIVVFVLIIRTKNLRHRMLYGTLIVVLFLPHIQRFVGDYYFDYLCRTQAGEFIYRTVDNVEGILQMRPRDGSKDYFDRMRTGDIPEDPWGHTNWEAQQVETMFVNPPWGNYLFLETLKPESSSLFPGERSKAVKGKEEPGARYRRFHSYNQEYKHPMVVDYVASPKSDFGYTWIETSSAIQRWMNIHRGEIHVVELGTRSVLARSVGLYRARPVQICPADKDDKFLYGFVNRVLRTNHTKKP